MIYKIWRKVRGDFEVFKTTEDFGYALKLAILIAKSNRTYTKITKRVDGSNVLVKVFSPFDRRPMPNPMLWHGRSDVQKAVITLGVTVALTAAYVWLKLNNP